MTWNPTHVQLTVLRARNLPTKGKGGARLNDVFVTIQLGKDKFQTSTIKNAVNPEWFEQCDLTIPHMHSEITIQVMHRGMLSDDFIGHTTIPLWEYKLYERPKSQWFHLKGKPHKPPDNKNRGELEIRITFQVKSKTEDVGSAVKNSKKSPKFKALASAVEFNLDLFVLKGQKVGDKFKFTRSRSLRDNRNDNDLNRYNPAQVPTSPESAERLPGYEDFAKQSVDLDSNTGIDFYVDGQVAALSNNKPVNFSAIDLSRPPQWEQLTVNERMARSHSMSLHTDRNRQGIEPGGDDSILQYNMNLPGNRRSLPPSYWGTQTLPHPRTKRSFLSEDTFQQRSSDDLNTSISSQPGYLEAMFHKEREVYKQMQGMNCDSTDDSAGKIPKQRKTAKEYTQDHDHSYDSDSEGSADEVKLPDVKRKPDSVGNMASNSNSSEKKESEENEDSSQTLTGSGSGSDLGLNSQPNKENNKCVTETSFPEDTTHPVYHSPRQENNKVTAPAENNLVNGEVLTAPPRHKKKISLEQPFKFGVSPDKVDVRRRSKRDSLRNYKHGGRRYTVQGLELPKRRSHGDLLDYGRGREFAMESSIPEDLLTVYRSMTKEELIYMVMTHKAQLMRKDQYIKDLEDYIDRMLVRVMENDPRLLQHPGRRF
ncbi:hypothetical protein KUTeg_023285 [Tegillarca granosa]|uniref:Rab11 family-interacting protein 1 n=1 Tax=Tegillarca granosa TaxID=220873 RepID=A0ABQ9E265_TEGGR|nr:hypothetical protein KUTeg_023285 [Tegillarca granosa]